MNKAQAIEALTKRWNEQALKYPSMRHDVPLAGYIKTNLKTKMRLEARKTLESLRRTK